MSLGAQESALLARITTQLEECSRLQHEAAKTAKVLREAATKLRLGYSARVVEAELSEHVGEMLEKL